MHVIRFQSLTYFAKLQTSFPVPIFLVDFNVWSCVGINTHALRINQSLLLIHDSMPLRWWWKLPKNEKFFELSVTYVIKKCAKNTRHLITHLQKALCYLNSWGHESSSGDVCEQCVSEKVISRVSQSLLIQHRLRFC